MLYVYIIREDAVSWKVHTVYSDVVCGFYEHLFVFITSVHTYLRTTLTIQLTIQYDIVKVCSCLIANHIVSLPARFTDRLEAILYIQLVS